MRLKTYILLPFLTFFMMYEVQAQYDEGYTERGIISYYAKKFKETTASGEKFDNTELVGSHKKIPFNSKVKITNLSNGKSVIVRINDRGPYAYGRIMDISKAAAEKIGLITTGTTKADIEVIDDGKPNTFTSEKTMPQKDESTENEETVSSITTSTTSQVVVTGKTYSLWLTPKTPLGYGQQVAYFEALENAQIFCKNLNEKGIQEEIYIQVGWLNNAKVYRIIIGATEDDELLKNIKEKISLIGYGSFKKPHFK